MLLTLARSWAHHAHGRGPLAFIEDGRPGRDMNPDLVSAIARLGRDNVLEGAQAVLFDRVARQRLVSVRFEVRALLSRASSS